jgi:hypothetical protein
VPAVLFIGSRPLSFWGGTRLLLPSVVAASLPRRIVTGWFEVALLLALVEALALLVFVEVAVEDGALVALVAAVWFVEVTCCD